ncbi:MAG TPA: cyclopropane-fatty-acyl-phospholipid synthase family protein [Acidimicrobiales bacterium]|nr:cyclopropane-fatty-acyl-phospholipid synthase family protein [Acidimicrobiales bacterium]
MVSGEDRGLRRPVCTSQAEPTIVPRRLKTPRHRRLRDRLARQVVLHLLGALHDGALAIAENGTRREFGEVVGGPPVPEITVRSPAAWTAVASGGSSGLGRGFFSGWWTVEELDDLVMAIRVIIRNLDASERPQRAMHALVAPVLWARVRFLERLGRHAADRRNIRAHYDLGNEFFSLFLDKTMTYSCALFDTEQESLDEAQEAKLDRLCRKLELTPHDHVLEIGTGWGSFAVHAARKYGCRVTTTTLSRQQFTFATEKIAQMGLADRVTVLLEDYRDLKGTYDKLVSIEMIEAVDWRQYGKFFVTCARLLKPDGLLALQAIVIADRYFHRAKQSRDFIKRYIFPGGCLPSVAAILEATSQVSDLELLALDDIGPHYAETLRRWRAGLESHKSELAALGFDETFHLLFDFYFCYCEAAFLERRISDVQCLFSRSRWRAPALGMRRG